MDFLTVLVVGLVTGLLASLFLGRGANRFARDGINGLLGAFLASWIVAGFNLRVPIEGNGGSAAVALLGAVAVLLLQRAAHLARRGWDRSSRTTTQSRTWRSARFR